MKKFLLILLLVFSLSQTYVFAEPDTLKVGGDNYYPPYEYLDDNQVYKGFNVDIMNAISIELGIDIELEPLDWDLALEKLKNGELDAVQGATISDARKEYFDFSDELLENSQVIFVNKDNEYIKSIDDLSGRKIAIQSDDIAYEKVSAIKDIQVLEFANQKSGIDALVDGRVDAFVGGRLAGLYYIQKSDFHDDVKISGDIMDSGTYAIAVKKGDTETLELLNEGLGMIRENGTYEKIYEKWFGESIYDVSKWKTLFWISSVILLSTLILSILMILINRLLKKEVSKRTQELSLSRAEIARKDRLKGSIIENVDVGIIAFNTVGEITNINKSANTMLSSNISEGDSYSDIGIMSNIDFDLAKKTIFTGPIERELQYNKGDYERILNYKLLPISDEKTLEGLLLCIFDMTEERKLNELIAHNDKMKSLGILSSGIAHEIRNPLTSIKMFVELLPTKKDNQSFIDKFMRIVPCELSRLNKLTSLLLDYSKTSKPNLEKIYSDDIIDDVLILTEPYRKKKNVTIERDLENIPLNIDKSQIKQVLLNIVLNGVDSFKEKGNLEIRSFARNNMGIIEISDDGKGISKADLDKIFDPFFTSKREGNGIGLSISKNLVKENFGKISISSELGVGTTVTLEFPIYK